MKVILPLKINYSPIKKLALINFEKKPDKLYKGLELQYIDGKSYGKGYRIIAYRNDDYVDVYDDYSLTYIENEKFNVVQNGLNKHVQTHLDNVSFERTNGNVEITFKFSDLLNREISVSIIEHSKKRSIPMNLLAPVGVGAMKPDFMPVFFLYDFDFVRRSKTAVNVEIDGKNIAIDKFPMPMNMQFRYYSRYSVNCQLIDFINTDYKKLIEVEMDDKLSFTENGVKYCFNSNGGLETVNIETGNNPIIIKFEPELTLNKDMDLEGKFSIAPAECMGYIKGDYQINWDENTLSYKLKLIPGEGWTPVPNSRITKMLFSPKSMFCCWTKKYWLEAVISLKDMTANGKWTNGNLEDSTKG
ncbi:hypothetical protein JK636_19275 [Clostridium sp. YIM B02515]|uniref:Uncharacterized protein n=1 Tax=Clostridium rhizosphaerae TaxID=2803861 RepID=A0ABS1TIR8_9CLOT|nr:hypothetical protein [Clostridium rhizosphaerae]MBL4937853.1 hypothetical protein [Clostridium rhizosphaerae]